MAGAPPVRRILRNAQRAVAPRQPCAKSPVARRDCLRRTTRPSRGRVVRRAALTGSGPVRRRWSANRDFGGAGSEGSSTGRLAQIGDRLQVFRRVSAPLTSTAAGQRRHREKPKAKNSTFPIALDRLIPCRANAKVPSLSRSPASVSASDAVPRSAAASSRQRSGPARGAPARAPTSSPAAADRDLA